MLANRAFVVKKIGVITGNTVGDEASEQNVTGQISWSKHDSPARAWEVAKHRANFI